MQKERNLSSVYPLTKDNRYIIVRWVNFGQKSWRLIFRISGNQLEYIRRPVQGRSQKKKYDWGSVHG